MRVALHSLVVLTALIAAVALVVFAAEASATVLVGRADGIRVRLDGRRLEMWLSRAPSPVSRPGRRARVTCGDDPFSQRLAFPHWVMRADRLLTLRGGAPHLVLRLGRDVSSRANACELRTIAPGYSALVRLVPVPGSAKPACVAAGREEVVARSDEALLLRARFSSWDGDQEVYRSCLLPRSRPRYVAERSYDFGDGGGVGRIVLSGHWIAWATAFASRRPDDERSPEIVRLDLRGDRATAIASQRPGLEYRGASLSAFVLAPTGTAAWVVQSSGAAELAVARPGQTRSLIDRVTQGSLGTPSLSPDGETIGWLRDGVAQRAPVPAQPFDPAPVVP